MMNSEYLTLAAAFGDLIKPLKAAKTNKVISEKELLLNNTDRPFIFAEAVADITA